MRNTLLTAGMAVTLILLAGIGLYLTACWSGDDTGEGTNVLLIVVDTLRADKLGCYGNGLGLTPHMDAFASEGVLFKNAFSHAPWTLPSFASMLTSTYPAQHGAGGSLPARTTSGLKGGFTSLRPGIRTLGETFQDAGYRTGAVVNVLFVTKDFGMERGFDDLDYVSSENNQQHLLRTAEKTTDTALNWIRKKDNKPFFLLVHYFDPHLAYEPPEEFRRKYALEGDREGRGLLFGNRKDIVEYRRGNYILGKNKIERLEALYHGEVAFTDREVGRLLAELGKDRLAPNTLVVITSDHGEEFYDHGGFEHGHTLYDELLHIPLMIRLDGRIPAGTVVEPAVRHLDLAPTICRLTGLESEKQHEGLDLMPLMKNGAPGDDRPVFCEGNFWGPTRFSRRAGRYKTIVHTPGGRTEIYDLVSDPGEKTNLAGRDPDLTNRLKADLSIVRQGMMIKAGTASNVSLTPEMEEHLRALGYLD